MAQTHTWSDLIRACNLLSMIEDGNGRPGEADYLNKREMGGKAREAREIFEPIAVACRDHSINPAAVPDLLEALKGTLHIVERYYQALPDDGPEQDNIMLTYIGPARAALAKAKDGE